MRTVTVLGGYGVFGARVSRALASTDGLAVRVAGRHRERGLGFADAIGARMVVCDLSQPASLDACLDGTDLLIHAAGPFQGHDHQVARACIRAGVHYLDLSDARDFVTSIVELDSSARAADLTVVSGASTAPAITGAMVSHLAEGLQSIESLEITLSPGNQNPRGSATIAAILSYLGRPHRVWIDGEWSVRHGWSGPRAARFPEPIGTRTVYACEVPDLDLFPREYGAHTVRFHAGLELAVLNRSLAALGWMRRRHLLPDLRGMAPLFRRASLLLARLGTRHGGLLVRVLGRDGAGASVDRRAALIADADGPATPAAPAILLARKLLAGDGLSPGARPATGMLTLSELVTHLAPTGTHCMVRAEDGRWESFDS
jgi:hypothetical protein